MPKDDPFTPEEKLEADMLAEDFTGAPIDHGSTVKAIAALEARLAHLRQRLEDSQSSDNSHLLRDIATTQTNLAAYREQLKARN